MTAPQIFIWISAFVSWMYLLSPFAVANDGLFRSDEFHFRAKIDASVRLCPAVSGTHNHGFYFNIDSQSDCSANTETSLSAIVGIYASYNTEFFESPEESLPEKCESSPFHLEYDIDGALSGIQGKIGKCSIKNSDGSIDIYISVQGGNWPSGKISSPWINYTASLHTYPSSINGDMKVFIRTVKSMEID